MRDHNCKSCPLNDGSKCGGHYAPLSGRRVDILFVLDSPSTETARHQKNYIDNDMNLRALDYLMNSTLMKYKAELSEIYDKHNYDVSYDFAYAVSCVVGDQTPRVYKSISTAENKIKPNMKSMALCRDYLFNKIIGMNPKVIIPVGDFAAKSLYLMFKKYNDVVARNLKTRIRNEVFDVIPIMNTERIKKNDNDYSVSQFAVKLALKNVFNKEYAPRLKQQIDISKYVFPRTVEEVKHLCMDVIIPSMAVPITPPNGKKERRYLGVDIETNTLHTYHKDAKMIMISFSWGEGESCAIWCDSTHAAWEWKEIESYIRAVLDCNAPKTFHGGTYDIKIIEYVYGLYIRNLKWDSLFAEHIIDENMKGFYNLEFVGGSYFPAFENYKKLALKKISNKDDLGSRMNSMPETEEANEISTSAILSSNNEEYQKAMFQYYDEDEVYNKSRSKHEMLKRVYNQETAQWKLEKEFLTTKFNEVKENHTAAVAIWKASYKTPKERNKEAALEFKPSKLVTKKEFFEELESRKPKRQACKSVRPKMPDMKKFAASDSKSNFEDYDPRDLEVYAAMDSDITLRVSMKQKEKLKKEDPRMLTIMSKQIVPAIRALSYIEFVGASTDQPYLDKISGELEKDYELLARKLVLITGLPDFKPNSPKQIGHILYSKFGVQPTEENLTEEGQAKTDKATLLGYAKHLVAEINPAATKDDYTMLKFMGTYDAHNVLGFISVLMTFRDVSKALKTTLVNFRKYSSYDKRLRSHFLINGTKTGRLSSSSLNLQNIALEGGGKNLKKFIVADKDDHVLVNVDIKAAEIRGLLAYANEEGLIDKIRGGFDMHSYVAAKVFRHLYSQFTEDQLYEAIVEAADAEKPSDLQTTYVKLRKNTKAVTFGLVYGISSYGLSRQLGTSEDEAQEIITLYFKTFPKIKEYMDDTFKILARQHEVQSLTFRKRRFPRYAINKGGSYRQAINFRVQNIASDLVVRILCAMHKNIQEELGGRIVLTVHDSILISLPKKNVGRLRKYFDEMIVTRVKNDYPWLPVPFEYDIEIGDNYGEMGKFV